MSGRVQHVKIVGRVMVCHHCGARETLVKSQRIGTLVLRMKTFGQLHHACPARVAVSA